MNIMIITLFLVVISFVFLFFGFRALIFKGSDNKNKMSGIAFIGIAITLATTALILSNQIK